MPVTVPWWPWAREKNRNLQHTPAQSVGPPAPAPGAQVRRNWRRRFTHRDRNRCSPVLPGGGGAEAGRVSVERLTAGTDRSATGISGSRPPPYVAV